MTMLRGNDNQTDEANSDTNKYRIEKQKNVKTKEIKNDINKCNKNNVIKRDIFKLFTNVNEIVIWISNDYQFDLLLLLNEIRGLSVFDTNNLKIKIRQYIGSIIKEYMNRYLSSAIKTKFKSENLTIEFHETDNLWCGGKIEQGELVIKKL